jgi:hypothetical protein
MKAQHILLRPCYVIIQNQPENGKEIQHHPESEWKEAYIGITSNIMQTNIQHQQYNGIHHLIHAREIEKITLCNCLFCFDELITKTAGRYHCRFTRSPGSVFQQESKDIAM